MESWRITLVAISIALIMATMVETTGEDKMKDKEECRQERMNMTTCLPFMKGLAKSPTPHCCSNLKQILNSDKNCICVIIQDRNDPDLDLPSLEINVSLAFSLPSICHVTANVAKCPALLHLDPNSPEARVFYQIAKALNETSPASAPIGSAPEPTPTLGSDDSHRHTSLPGTSHAQSFRKRWLGLQVIVHIFVILYLIRGGCT